MTAKEILKKYTIIFHTIDEIKEFESITSDEKFKNFDLYTKCKYTFPMVAWLSNASAIDHIPIESERIGIYIDKVRKSVDWNNIKDKYIKEPTCNYCGSKLQETAMNANYADGSFCSSKCAEKTDLIILLDEIKKEKRN